MYILYIRKNHLYIHITYHICISYYWYGCFIIFPNWCSLDFFHQQNHDKTCERLVFEPDRLRKPLAVCMNLKPSLEKESRIWNHNQEKSSFTNTNLRNRRFHVQTNTSVQQLLFPQFHKEPQMTARSSSSFWLCSVFFQHTIYAMKFCYLSWLKITKIAMTEHYHKKTPRSLKSFISNRFSGF